MIIPSRRSVLATPSLCKTVPIIENRSQFAQVLDTSHRGTILLRHCNLFDFTALLHDAHLRELAVYVNVDHIDGIHPDPAGLRYLAERLQITGIVSNHPRTLS